MRVYKNLFNKGFTLVELLVVIAIIAILFAVILIAINPAQRFKDSRNSRRLADVKSIVEAATTYTADRRGTQLPDVPDYQCVGSKSAQDFQTTPPTGSTAFWLMDETTGSLTDSVSTANNLTASSITYEASGRFNKALQLDGAISSLLTADQADLDSVSPGSTALTVEGWIKLNQKIEPGSFDHHQALFDKGNYRLQFNGDSGKLEFEIYPSAATPLAGLDYSSSAVNVKINTLAQYQDSLYAGAETSAGGKILSNKNGIWEVFSDNPPSSNKINALAVYNDKLYSGQLSNDNSARVYAFDGAVWQDTNLNIPGSIVLSLIRYKGKLYAGIGREISDSNGASIWEYDGTSWKISTSFTSSPSHNALDVHSFSIFRGKLYAGTGSGLTDDNARLYEFNGNDWVQKFSPSDFAGNKDAIYSLTVYQNELYIGLGGNISGNAAVYKWNGTALSGPLPATSTPTKYRVSSLAVYNGMLNAGWSGPASGDGQVYYYASGPTWTVRGDNFTTKEIGSLIVYKGKLYAATGGTLSNEATIQPFGNKGFIDSQKKIWQSNAWYHILAMYNGGAQGQMSIAINGSVDVVSSSNIPVNLGDNGRFLYLGSGYSSDPFYGALDNLAIYNNTALSADEVASHAGCYNLGQYLAPEYMGSLPIDPSSTVTDGTDTGYFISKDTSGVITITAPLTETTSSIPEIIKASR